MNKAKIIAIILMTAVSFFSIAPAVIQAQTIPPTPTVTIRDIGQVHRLLETIINWFFAFFFAIAVLYLLLGAFGYLREGEGKDGANKKKIIYAVIAIAIALLARSFTPFLQSILGLGAS